MLEDHTAHVQTAADKLVNEVMCRLGIPFRIHTDQGREFKSALFAELFSLLVIIKFRTTPYHPQSDGQVVRLNHTLQQMLSIFVNENRSNWDDHLPYLMMAYYSTVPPIWSC